MERSWQTRQVEMEEWYKELARDQDRAVGMLSHDYQPYAQILASLEGDVIDVGGGLV